MLRRTGAIALLCLLAACASAPPSSQTPASQTAVLDTKKGDGIGGTGIRTAAKDRRGDGIGGTGILGTISGFGSIIVNGLELEFNHATGVESDGQPASLNELRVGQVVQGVAHSRDGKLYLDTLEIQHAVSGPISAIDHATETMTILGQKVRLNLAGDKSAIDAFKSLQPGDAVSVSGLRLSDGTIIATRVDQKRDDGRTVVRGSASSVTANSLRIGGLDVGLGDAVTTVTPTNGGRVLVSGRMINNQFVADVVAGAGAQPFGEDVDVVSLESYVPPNAGKGGLVIHGMPVDGASLPEGVAANDRIVVTGRIGADGKISATSITKVHTVVSILQARGSLRPAAVRPDMSRPERVRPPDRPERQESRPEIPKPPERPPVFERPSSNCC